MFKEDFESILKKRAVACVFCECEIDYAGRAESHLSKGERLIIVKADRSLLIHQPEGQNPVNYMKAGTNFSVEEKNGTIVLQGENHKDNETMSILITKVHTLTSQQLTDGKKLSLFGSEKDMSDMIKEHPSLISNDFIPLSREEHVKFGFVDVFGHDGQGNLVVIECKRYTAGLKDIEQVRRYVEKIEKLKGITGVKGILASPDITPNASAMLQEWGYEWKKVEPPRKRIEKVKGQKGLDCF